MNHTLRNFTGAILAISALFVQDTRAGVAQPSGIANVTVPAGVGRTEFFGTPFARPVEASGTVTSVDNSGSNAVLTLSLDAGFTLPASADLANTDVNVDKFYVVEILDGPAIGLILDIVDGTSSSLSVKGKLPSSLDVSSGSKFAVRKAWTLSSLFGPASSSNVFGRGLSSTANGVNAQVQVLSASGTLTTYFIHVSGTSYNWRASTGTANRNHEPLGLGKGFAIVNRKAAPLSLNLSGEYRTSRTRLVIPAGQRALVANPGVFDTDFIESTIPATSPNRGTGNPNAGHDLYQVWDKNTARFTSYRIGGVNNSNGPTAYTLLNARTNPAISKFTSMLVTPGGSNSQVITIAPKLSN